MLYVPRPERHADEPPFPSLPLYSLIPGARRKHRGPRDGGVTKNPKKGNAKTKLSTIRRCEKLYHGAADGTGLTTGRCLPTERSRDMRTDEEKRRLLAWVGSRPFSRCSPSHTDSSPLLLTG